MPEHVPDLARFYRVDAPDDRLDALPKAPPATPNFVNGHLTSDTVGI